MVSARTDFGGGRCEVDGASGAGPRSAARLAEGQRDVINDIRLGTQIGDAQYALVNRIPSAASLSRCGVRTRPSSLHPKWNRLCWSDMITKTLN